MRQTALIKALRRLKDILVDELSLVDRPANQEPFLVMKRSELVEDGTQTNESESTDAPAQETPEGEERTAPANPTLSAAVQALEALTQAVEGLDGDEQLGDMEGELRESLVALLAQLGAPPSPPATDSGGKAQIAAELRRAIDELKLVTAPPAAPALPAEPAVPVTPRAPDVETEPDDRVEHVRDALAMLESTVRAFGETVKAQGERLTKIEKQAGLPNSQGAEGRRAPSPRAASSWPLDFNHPMDRDSVNKDVSFHDI